MVEIIKNIFIGDLKDAETTNADIVLNFSESCLFDETGKILYFNIPMLDSSNFPIHKYFDIIWAIVETAIKNKKKILINCRMGLSRSVTIYAMLLMRMYNISHTEALKAIEDHKEIDPNFGFVNQLKKYGH